MKNIEKVFVKNFIKKEYQERILYELTSSKKRSKAFYRFAHNSIEILQTDKIINKTSNLSCENVNAIFQYPLSNNEYCYIITEDLCLAKPILNVLECDFKSIQPIIIVYMNNDFIISIVKEEVETKSQIYILKSKMIDTTVNVLEHPIN